MVSGAVGTPGNVQVAWQGNEVASVVLVLSVIFSSFFPRCVELALVAVGWFDISLVSVGFFKQDVPCRKKRNTSRE